MFRLHREHQLPFFCIVLLAAIATLLGVSGCGTRRSINDRSVEGTGLSLEPGSSPSPGPSSSPLPSPTSTARPRKGVPPLIIEVRGVGYNKVQTQVVTGKTLKVLFTPGIQDRTVAGTGFSPEYSKMGVYLSAGNSSEQPTEMLSNGYLPMTESQSSHVFDFSGSLGNECPASDASCRRTVVITVSRPNYDYWCLTSRAYCPYSHVYETHPWNGTLSIETDDTDSLE